MKKIVVKSAIEDEKSKRKALKLVAGIQGVDSVAADMKEKKITIIGNADPVEIAAKLRKLAHTEILSVGPAKEEKKEKDQKEGKKPDTKKETKDTFWRLPFPRNFDGFWSPTIVEHLEKPNQQVRDVRQPLDSSVNFKIPRQSTRRLDQSPIHLLDFQPVGIEEQVREVKALLDMEGAQSALAVIVYGFGGLGKTTLAASVVQSLDWSSTDFRFCMVTIDEKAPDKTSHIIKLQKTILYDLGGVKPCLRDHDDGLGKIKEALEKRCSLLFIDNVVDKDYIQYLLPKNLSSSDQETKLRIIMTSREKNVKEELNPDMMCKEYEVKGLSDADAKRLLLETILA